MLEITVGSKPAHTVFDLLGEKENDITYALGWGLAQSGDLLLRFLRLAGADEGLAEKALLHLQLYCRDNGQASITDIEVVTPRSHVIVEAKRGWNLPLKKQLCLYLPRLRESKAGDRRFVVLTQWGEESYVRAELGSELEGFPIVTVGLGQIAKAATEAAKAERRLRFRLLMYELGSYLTGVADMRDVHDNRVYVVSLSTALSEAGISYIDVVRELGLYWYPAGKNWPKTPPNYMGFRYGGKLRSIHHVDQAVVVSDLSEAVRECSNPSFGPAFVLTLGESIPVPPGIRTGPRIVRSARRLIDIDLLLSSSTISEAWEKMQERHVQGPSV